MNHLNPVLTDPLQFFAIDMKPALQRVPLFQIGVSAGFPSPAADYIQKTLDLNEHLIQHPAASFVVRVQGRSMVDANLFDGDLLLVDRSLQATHKAIVVAVINGDFTVKRFLKTASGIMLKAESSAYPPIHVTEDMDFEIWGVVTHIIHKAQ